MRNGKDKFFAIPCKDGITREQARESGPNDDNYTERMGTEGVLVGYYATLDNFVRYQFWRSDILEQRINKNRVWRVYRGQINGTHRLVAIIGGDREDY